MFNSFTGTLKRSLPGEAGINVRQTAMAPSADIGGLSFSYRTGTGPEVLPSTGLLYGNKPDTSAQFRKEFLVIDKISPGDFGYGEDKMAMGDRLDYVLAEPLAKFYRPFLVAGRAEVPAFAGKCQEILVATALTPDTGKSIMEVTTVKIAINNLSHIGSKKPVLPLKPFLIDLLECLEMVFNALVIR